MNERERKKEPERNRGKKRKKNQRRNNIPCGFYSYFSIQFHLIVCYTFAVYFHRLLLCRGRHRRFADVVANRQ